MKAGVHPRDMDPGLRRGDGQEVAAVRVDDGTINVRDRQRVAAVRVDDGTINVRDRQRVPAVRVDDGTINVRDRQRVAAASLDGGTVNMHVTPAKAGVHGRRPKSGHLGALGNDGLHRHDASPAQSRGRRKSLYSRASGVPASGCQS
jgi:hypothetical protein